MARILTVFLLAAVATLGHSVPSSRFLERFRRREPEIVEFPRYEDDSYATDAQGQDEGATGRELRPFFSFPNFDQIPSFGDFPPSGLNFRWPSQFMDSQKFSDIFKQFDEILNNIQDQLDYLWKNQANIFNSTHSLGEFDTNIGNFGDLPPNYHNSTFDTKVVNGSKVTVNETIHTSSEDGTSSFYHFKVVNIQPTGEPPVEGTQTRTQDSQKEETATPIEEPGVAEVEWDKQGAATPEGHWDINAAVEEKWDKPSATNSEGEWDTNAALDTEWDKPAVSLSGSDWDNNAAVESEQAGTGRGERRTSVSKRSSSTAHGDWEDNVLSNEVNDKPPGKEVLVPIGDDLRVNRIRGKNGLHMIDPDVELIDVVDKHVIVPRKEKTASHGL